MNYKSIICCVVVLSIAIGCNVGSVYLWQYTLQHIYYKHKCVNVNTTFVEVLNNGNDFCLYEHPNKTPGSSFICYCKQQCCTTLTDIRPRSNESNIFVVAIIVSIITFFLYCCCVILILTIFSCI